MLELFGLPGIRPTALEESRLRLLIACRFLIIILKLVHEILALLACILLILHQYVVLLVEDPLWHHACVCGDLKVLGGLWLRQGARLADLGGHLIHLSKSR